MAIRTPVINTSLALEAWDSRPPAGTGRSYRVKTLGQSNNVGSGSIQEFIASYAARAAATTGTYATVHIWNIKSQQWQPYSPQVNAQGFTGTTEDGTPGYDVGFCYFWGLAQWWSETMGPSDHLFLEKSGGVNQAMHYFLASDGDGVDNAFHRVANTVWIPAENAQPSGSFLAILFCAGSSTDSRLLYSRHCISR